MAGHSKWAQIKRKKAAIDAKRGKVFTRLLKEITVAARMGGGDPAGNPRLRNAITEAKNSNVPNDNIDRAVKKGTGELEGMSLEEISYEGYGPGGVAVFIEAVTDNRNRTVGEIRHLFSRFGGNLGENGCVGWMFDKKGLVLLERDGLDEEAFVELAVEVGAVDFSVEDEGYQLEVAPTDYLGVVEELEEREVEVAVKELAMVPQTTVEVPDDAATDLLRLLDALEEHDDVQNVWANHEVSDEVLEMAPG